MSGILDGGEKGEGAGEGAREIGVVDNCGHQYQRLASRQAEMNVG